MTSLDLTPAELGYRITRGDDFADTVTINEGGQPADLTARTYAAQVRKAKDDTEVVAAMTIDDSDAADGVIGYALSSTVTAGMSGVYFWDFEQTAAGITRTLMGGVFRVESDVTRAA